MELVEGHIAEAFRKYILVRDQRTGCATLVEPGLTRDVGSGHGRKLVIVPHQATKFMGLIKMLLPGLVGRASAKVIWDIPAPLTPAIDFAQPFHG